MKNVDKIIEDTVNRTVLKLKIAGLMKDDRKSAAQKTTTKKTAAKKAAEEK